MKVESSNIEEVLYKDGAGVLTITFKNGGVYEYSGVPQDTFKEFLKSESVGKFFFSRIKDKFDFKKLAPKEKKEKKDVG